MHLEAQNRQFGSFAELNAWLGERCRSLWSELRHPEHGQFSVADMLELERAEMMPVPTPFDGYVETEARVSSTCLVRVARNRYSVPCELAGQRVSTRLYPDRVMARVLAAMPTAGMDAVLVAVALVVESGALSAEHVENVLARLNASPQPPSVETSLQLKEAPLANTSRYDSLRGIDEAAVAAVEASHA